MDNTEIYLKYGVPMPETCQKLKLSDFQRDFGYGNHTKLFWVKHCENYEVTKSGFEVCHSEKVIKLVYGVEKTPFSFTNAMKYVDCNTLKVLKKGSVYESWQAPQMHEIAPLLPLSFKRNYSSYLYFINNVTIGYSSSKFGEWVDDYPNNTLMKTFIENHHYAQAYAELYLKLKEKGLI